MRGDPLSLKYKCNNSVYKKCVYPPVTGGIPSPIFYGAAIDSTCIKWGTNNCGEPGACRMYDSDAYRYLFITCIYRVLTINAVLHIRYNVCSHQCLLSKSLQSKISITHAYRLGPGVFSESSRPVCKNINWAP